MNRLNPSIFCGRYYHLRKLRQCNEYVIRKYLKEVGNCSLLDYGCGDSPYRPLYEPHVTEYLGADIERNKSADLVISLPSGKVNSSDSRFDILLSTQVLEHVTDPKRYLEEAHRLLKPGGTLVLSTHGYWMYHPDPTDFWRWTRDGLERTISAEGFEIIETMGIFNRFASGLQLFQDGLLFKLPAFLKPLWALVFALLQMVFDNGKLTNRDASVFMVIARKKAGVANPGQ
ncbi:MAG: class I SAM-dependent methyltransferase [Bacteroidota bacterium]